MLMVTLIYSVKDNVIGVVYVDGFKKKGEGIR